MNNKFDNLSFRSSNRAFTTEAPRRSSRLFYRRQLFYNLYSRWIKRRDAINLASSYWSRYHTYKRPVSFIKNRESFSKCYFENPQHCLRIESKNENDRTPYTKFKDCNAFHTTRINEKFIRTIIKFVLRMYREWENVW